MEPSDQHGTNGSVTKDELNDMAAKTLSESASNLTMQPRPEGDPLEAKKAPPVAPKPAWIRQSLERIQSKHYQRDLPRSTEQKPSCGLTRPFAQSLRSTSSTANLPRSLKDKIKTFETFSSPGPREMTNRRLLAPSASLPLMVKTPNNDRHAKEKHTREHIEINMPCTINSPSSAGRPDEHAVISSPPCSSNSSATAFSPVETIDQTVARLPLVSLDPINISAAQVSSEEIDAKPDEGTGGNSTVVLGEGEMATTSLSKQPELIPGEVQQSGLIKPIRVSRMEPSPSTSETPERDSQNGEEKGEPPQTIEPTFETDSPTLGATLTLENTSLMEAETEGMERILEFSYQVSLCPR